MIKVELEVEEECCKSQIITKEEEEELKRENEMELVSCPSSPSTKPFLVESGQAQIPIQLDPKLEINLQLSGHKTCKSS